MSGGNHYRDYFPGSRYLDAYGNSYYNTSGVYVFHRTEELYKAYPSKSFMFSEWGLSIDDPNYIRAIAEACVIESPGFISPRACRAAMRASRGES